MDDQLSAEMPAALASELERNASSIDETDANGEAVPFRELLQKEVAAMLSIFPAGAVQVALCAYGETLSMYDVGVVARDLSSGGFIAVYRFTKNKFVNVYFVSQKLSFMAYREELLEQIRYSSAVLETAYKGMLKQTVDGVGSTMSSDQLRFEQVSRALKRQHKLLAEDTAVLLALWSATGEKKGVGSKGVNTITFSKFNALLKRVRNEIVQPLPVDSALLDVLKQLEKGGLISIHTPPRNGVSDNLYLRAEGFRFLSPLM